MKKRMKMMKLVNNIYKNLINEVNKNYIMDFHPECVLHNYDEIAALTNVVRDKNNVIIDPLHKTIPFLTKYEKARILGQRAKQINSGATPFVKVPENVIDGYLIAELELAEKRIPFIIRRPLPNGGSEYWNIKDLEIIGFLIKNNIIKKQYKYNYLYCVIYCVIKWNLKINFYLTN